MARWRRKAAIRSISFEKINGLRDIPNVGPKSDILDLHVRSEDTSWIDDVSARVGMHLLNLWRQPNC